MPPYDYVPTGELHLQIDYYWAKRKNWRDLSNKKLEDFVGEFVLAVVTTLDEKVIKDKQDKLEQERRRQ